MSAINLGVAGGLNYAVDPAQIKDDELTAAYNVIFSPSSGVLKTRDGIAPVGDTLSTGIDIVYPFTRKTGESWLVCVSNKTLYSMDPTAEAPEWTSVVALSSNAPSMIGFNGNLLIADGDAAGIMAWDGTTAARVAGSPQCDAIFEHGNRVVCNSLTDGDLDGVYFSAAEDHTKWTTEDGAVIVRAGYGDGMRVNGFAAISDTLVVSKCAYVDGVATRKKLWGIQTASTAANWYAKDVSSNNAALGPHCIVGAHQDVLYIDAEGFEALTPTQQYGDIANNPTIGGRINRVLKNLLTDADSARLCLLPNQSALYLFLPGKKKVFVYSMLTRAFTLLEFAQNMNHAADYGGTTYFAGADGQLYCYDPVSTVDTIGEVESEVVSVIRWKRIEAPARSVLYKTFLRIVSETDGTMLLEAYPDGDSKRLLQSFPVYASSISDMDLYEATGDLADASDELYSAPNKRLVSRSRVSFFGLMLQVRARHGARLEVSGISCNINVVSK
jgi:hypothetical protein